MHGCWRAWVKPGSRVALHMPNCPQYVIVSTTLRAGCIVTPATPLCGAELIHQLNDSGAEAIVTLSRFTPCQES